MAGLNAGSPEATSIGLGTDDQLGARLGTASALGSDEQGSNPSGNAAGTSTALGSDPSDSGRVQGAVVGNQSLLMENDNATSNSNVGAAGEDPQAI